MVQLAPVQKHADHVELEQCSLAGSQRTVLASNGQIPLTLEAVQDLLMTTQAAIIANTNAAIAAAQADFQIYIKHELAGLEARISAAEKR
ncbi:hypothetical protein C0995_000267 [Termitomyces sp. Mi166|nr:hypothetical protein C0995_000267 [Termitomyces sp. Mi166\